MSYRGKIKRYLLILERLLRPAHLSELQSFFFLRLRLRLLSTRPGIPVSIP